MLAHKGPWYAVTFPNDFKVNGYKKLYPCTNCTCQAVMLQNCLYPPLYPSVSACIHLPLGCANWKVEENRPHSKRTTMADETVATRCTPLSRELLRTKTECPGCGATMQYRTLAYKHRCPKNPSDSERLAEREKRMKKLQQRAVDKFNQRVTKYADVAAWQKVEQPS